MINFIQPGDVLDFTAPAGGVVSGTPVLIGALLVVPQVTAAATVLFAGVVVGVVSAPKAASQAWTEGAIVYWDDTAKVFTTAAAGNTRAGVAAEAVAGGAGDVIGIVRLDGVTGTGTGADVVANGAVAPTEIAGSVLRIIPLTFADAATTTYEYENADKIEIIDVWGIKDGAGAANTIQVTDSADAAITDALAFAVDKTVTHASTIDKAKRTLAAGAGFKVVNTRAAGTSAGQLFLLVIGRA